MAKKSKAIGFGFTAKQREKLALRHIVQETAADPRRLAYVEDKRSKTGRVVDNQTGELFGIFSH